jgi:hypothetical protein
MLWESMRELETARFGNLFATPVLPDLWTDSVELSTLRCVPVS